MSLAQATTNDTERIEFKSHPTQPVVDDSVSLSHEYLTTAFTFAYVLVTVLSLVGNSLILVVLLRRKRMRRTVTNFFLANITLANLIYTVCAPLQFAFNAHRVNWPATSAMCTLLPFVSTVAINVNTFSMVAASVERYTAIAYPLANKLNKRKCCFIIVGIWVIATTVALPWFFLIRSVRPMYALKFVLYVNHMPNICIILTPSL